MALRFTLIENPQAATTRAPGVSARAVERYLCSQAGVVSATVWWEEGQLQASVTLSDLCNWDAGSLKTACFDHLGPAATPRKLSVMWARQFAA